VGSDPLTIARHLLFDFGGPVLRSPFELRGAAAAALGVGPDVFAGGPFDPEDLRWRARVDGAITEREYWEHEAGRFALDVQGYMALFYEPSGDHLTRAESCALVEEVLAAGRRVGLLTNDLTAFHGPEWQEPIGVLRRFDPIVDLSHSGHLKPDPRAYAVGIEAMGVPAGDVVFVDDHVDNVANGADAGLVAVWFDVTDVDGSLGRVRAALAG
jgi:putative hydrolase of the HAD superfamily